MFKKLLVLVMICSISFCGFGDVLLWTVNESTKVDGIPIQTFLEQYTSDYDHFPAARVRMILGDGTSSILSVIGVEDKPAYWGQEPYDSGSGCWGIGAPVGVQSKTGYNVIQPV